MLPVEKLGSKPLPSAAISTVSVPPGCGGSAGAVLAVVVTWAMPPRGFGAVALVNAEDAPFLAVVAVDFLVVVVPPAGAVVVGVVSPVAVVDVFSPSVVDVSSVVPVVLLVFF